MARSHHLFAEFMTEAQAFGQRIIVHHQRFLGTNGSLGAFFREIEAFESSGLSKGNGHLRRIDHRAGF
jgi:hypothetical protein